MFEIVIYCFIFGYISCLRQEVWSKNCPSFRPFAIMTSVSVFLSTAYLWGLLKRSTLVNCFVRCLGLQLTESRRNFVCDIAVTSHIAWPSECVLGVREELVYRDVLFLKISPLHIWKNTPVTSHGYSGQRPRTVSIKYPWLTSRTVADTSRNPDFQIFNTSHGCGTSVTVRDLSHCTRLVKYFV